MRTLATLIEQSPLEIENAVRTMIAVCSAYVPDTSDGYGLEELEPRDIWISGSGGVTIERRRNRLARLRHQVSSAKTWFRYSFLPRFIGGPRIIVTRNVISWLGMDTHAFAGMLRRLLANSVPAELEAILRDVLAPERAPTPGELANALADFLAARSKS